MFTGIQLLQPEIFRYIPRGRFSHSTTDVYPAALAGGEKIVAHIARGNWRELSTLERYLETTLELLREKGLENACSEGARIESGARVAGSILWENAVVESGATVTNSILGAGVRIKRGETYERAALVRAELLKGETPPDKAPEGYLTGENFVVRLA